MADVRKLCVVCSQVYRSEQTTCPDDGTQLVVEASGSGDTATRLGHVVGNYRLLRVLGEGGVGTVYEAEHVRLGRKMAIKLLHADVVNDEMVTRLFNEARAVNEIRHPNIIEVEDFVTTQLGEHYMVMELLEGEDLRSLISREGTLAPARVAAIGSQVASALAAVHAVGIVHRDLKPDNIFIVQRHGEEVCKLLDFGVAKFASDEQGLTREGMTMGTPAYMAPEMIISGREQEVGVGVDIYALGMVLYEALTGEAAFGGTQLAAVLRAHCFEPVMSPSKRRGEALPAVLEAAVLKCLEKKAEQRFLSAEALKVALFAERPVKLSGELLVPRAAVQATRASRRRTVMMLPAFLMAAAALVLTILPRSRDEAASTAVTPGVAVAAAEPSPPPSVTIALSSQPAGASLFVGRARDPLGATPMTATLRRSTSPIEIIARFPDGTEVVESVVPDHALPALVFAKPAVRVEPAVTPPSTKKPRTKRVAPALATKPSTNPDERDATLDPFKQ